MMWNKGVFIALALGACNLDQRIDVGTEANQAERRAMTEDVIRERLKTSIRESIRDDDEREKGNKGNAPPFSGKMPNKSKGKPANQLHMPLPEKSPYQLDDGTIFITGDNPEEQLGVVCTQINPSVQSISVPGAGDGNVSKVKPGASAVEWWILRDDYAMLESSETLVLERTELKAEYCETLIDDSGYASHVSFCAAIDYFSDLNGNQIDQTDVKFLGGQGQLVWQRMVIVDEGAPVGSILRVSNPNSGESLEFYALVNSYEAPNDVGETIEFVPKSSAPESVAAWQAGLDSELGEPVFYGMTQYGPLSSLSETGSCW